MVNKCKTHEMHIVSLMYRCNNYMKTQTWYILNILNKT